MPSLGTGGHGDWSNRVVVQDGEEGLEQGTNGVEKIELPISTQDNEVFLIEHADIMEVNHRLGSGEERTTQYTISTDGSENAIAGEGEPSREVGFDGESVFWLAGHYYFAEYTADGHSQYSEKYNVTQTGPPIAFPYGHMYLNYEILDETGSDGQPGGYAYNITGQVVEVDNDTLVELLRTFPDPRIN